jgi:hypothetical protein
MIIQNADNKYRVCQTKMFRRLPTMLCQPFYPSLRGVKRRSNPLKKARLPRRQKDGGSQ